jgi:iron complex outermembrane receptor protein
VNPTLIVIRGSDHLDAESLLAFDAGYRSQLAESVTVDLAVFHNRYEQLLENRLGAPESGVGPPPRLVLPIELASGTEAHSYGGELSALWQVLPWWRLSGWYSYLKIDLEDDPDALDPETGQGTVPRHQFFLRSSMNLPWRLEFDAMLRFVDRLRETDVAAYVELDLRLGWQATERLELSIVGQNLLHDHHREARGGMATGIERGAYGQVRWAF